MKIDPTAMPIASGTVARTTNQESIITSIPFERPKVSW